MDCREFSNLLDTLPERPLSEAEAAQMTEHLKDCPSCRVNMRLAQDLRALQAETETPESFSAAWRERIREEEKMDKKAQKKKSWRGILAAAAALVLVVGGTLATRENRPADGTYAKEAGGISSSYNGLMDYSASNTLGAAPRMMAMEDAVYSEPSEMPMEAEIEESTAEKIIRTASFTLKTTEFEETLKKLEELTRSFGGRVEYLSRKGDAESGEIRSASLTLRIPTHELDGFLAGTDALGRVTSLVQEARDVSDSYYDVQNRLKTQQEKLERLRALMAQAVDVEDLIEIEASIADTQYLIDSYTAQLKNYDSRVDYSTVEVSLREVKITEVKEVSLWDRIAEGFRDSLEEGKCFLQDMAVFLASALPWLLGIGAAAVLIRIIVHKFRNRKEKAK